jgi:hypothetical protein
MIALRVWRRQASVWPRASARDFQVARTGGLKAASTQKQERGPGAWRAPRICGKGSGRLSGCGLHPAIFNFRKPAG